MLKRGSWSKKWVSNVECTEQLRDPSTVKYRGMMLSSHICWRKPFVYPSVNPRVKVGTHITAPCPTRESADCRCGLGSVTVRPHMSTAPCPSKFKLNISVTVRARCGHDGLVLKTALQFFHRMTASIRPTDVSGAVRKAKEAVNCCDVFGKGWKWLLCERASYPSPSSHPTQTTHHPKTALH
ncbi:hypothetical protein J6590_039289 [Homalodisca vitripennis]|nr:hypothetical protein J6590_039289 [Homalodisca vitripennis]